MARKSKEENKQQELKLKEAINELELLPNDEIYIHEHNVYGDNKYLVKDIENNLLNKKVMTINNYYNKKSHEFDKLRFIIE